MSGDDGLLWHYTSGAVLASILKNEEIWLTDPEFLNDAEEIRHGFKVLELSFREAFKARYQDFLDAGLAPELANSWMRHQADLFAGRSRPLGVPLRQMSFELIFCLSERKDQLSQWRAYGNGEYSVGFDAEELARLASARLLKVDYTEAKPNSALVDRLRRELNHPLKYIKDGKFTDAEVAGDGISHVLQGLWQDRYFIRTKNAAFAEESEVRLVRSFARRRLSKDREVDFEGIGRYPTPVAKVKVIDWSKGVCPIKKIVSGPGADPLRTDALQRTIGDIYCTNISFEKSNVPYRNK